MSSWDFLGYFKAMVKYDDGIVFSGSVGLILVLFSGVLIALFSYTLFQQMMFSAMFLLGIILMVYALYRYNNIDDYIEMRNSRNKKRKYHNLEYDLTTEQSKVE